jgi:hypothetical protein
MHRYKPGTAMSVQACIHGVIAPGPASERRAVVPRNGTSPAELNRDGLADRRHPS